MQQQGKTVVPLREDWTPTGWGMMFARCGGQHIPRTPIVLVHGFVVSSRYMVPTAELLAAECPVWAVDLPGFGRSCRPGRALTFAELAEALEQWLSAKGIDRVHLFGNSMGCQILAEYALRYRGRIDRLVLHGPTVDRHARSFWPQLWRQILNSLRERRSMTAVLVKDFIDFGLARALVTLRELLSDRIEEKLPRLDMPVLVVRGEKDPICPAQWAIEVASLLPRGELVVIPGEAHAVNFSKPSALIAAMRPFLRL